MNIIIIHAENIWMINFIIRDFLNLFSAKYARKESNVLCRFTERLVQLPGSVFSNRIKFNVYRSTEARGSGG